MTSVQSVCVFCGSNAGRRPQYVEAARETARVLTANGIDIVYGGGHVGLMGALADEALARGGRVVGVIPEHLMRPEVAHQRLTELIVVDSMHTRKRTMAARSDAFMILPGGYGTLEEMFEMLTWLQLRLQAKPVGILNVQSYFTPVIDFLQRAVDEQLIRREHQRLLLVASEPAELLGLLDESAARLNRKQPAVDNLSLS